MHSEPHPSENCDSSMLGYVTGRMTFITFCN